MLLSCAPFFKKTIYTASVRLSLAGLQVHVQNPHADLWKPPNDRY